MSKVTVISGTPAELLGAFRQLNRSCGFSLTSAEFRAYTDLLSERRIMHDRFDFHPVGKALATARTICEMVDPDASMVRAVLLSAIADEADSEMIESTWGADVNTMVQRLISVRRLYSKSASVESDNFRKLLLTFAQDIRVIIIMIVDRLTLMRAINHHPRENLVREIAYEANYLYAPLAHRLGLYAIKSELEDMSLKYSNREVYSRIASELNQTKSKRDKYIAEFIAPLKKRLEDMGLKFEIKGRTKSIYSIWNKIKKQHTTLDGIYDLFAIRIIIDCVPEREKSECWLAYSVVTDMYRPNPARLKDWVSIPKSNGYESLHTTVYGPEERWVEVQIRTRRMDEVAEKGLAAHWKYKGIKSESGLDTWMNNVRDILEAAHTGPMELMKNFTMDVYSHEVFVFTPKGDVYKLPQGATVLDFAFNIHTGVGAHCVGGRVNGRNRKINYRLESGDTVEILTSQSQEPNSDWLGMVVTSRARNKIRAILKESEHSAAEPGRELIERRFRNRKIELEESALAKTITRMGYKNTIAFFSAVGDGQIDVNEVIEVYQQILKPAEETATVSASTYVMPEEADGITGRPDGGAVVIGDGVKGVDYRLAACCNPIYGDDVFGFISSEGVIKIHRNDCPNAPHLRDKYGYRLIRVRWSGKLGNQFAATLRVVGKDDIGIVTNISSVINKEKSVTLRSISIDSNDGLFSGIITVGIPDTAALDTLIKKIKTVKGVKNVERSK